MKFVIVAGGQGVKLWPLSTQIKPKHFQNVLYDQSSFSWNVETLLSAFSADDILINTKRMYLPIAIQQAPQIPLRNFIIEPDARVGRAASDGLVFAYMAEKYPGEPMMTVQADNFRKPEDKYLEMVTEMDRLIRRDKKLITGGEKALFPTLGVDYLQLGERVEMDGILEFYKIDKFVYRLDTYKETKKLVENFHVVKHVNHFAWYPEMFLDEYKKHKPKWHTDLEKIRKVLDDEDKMTKIFNGMEKGVTEDVLNHTMENSYAVLVPFDWVDYGAWNSVFEILSDNGDVVTSGKVVALNSKRSIVKSTDPEKLIAVYGIENLVIVDSGENLLIMPLDESEKIKTILAEIKKEKFEDHL